MLQPVLIKNDSRARWIIFSVSLIVLIVVVILSKVEVKISESFDVHIFALANAIINSTVAILLIAALVAIKQDKYTLHRNIMLAAIILSLLFLLSYIAHHLLAGKPGLVTSTKMIL